jgi:hypothetical protein
MSKKKKRIIKHKHINRPIIKEVELDVEPIKLTKRKYHKKRVYIRKQPIVPIVVVEPPIIDKQIPIQFDIIPKKLAYGIIALVMVISMVVTVITLSIPPEPIAVTADGSYLSMQVR